MYSTLVKGVKSTETKGVKLTISQFHPNYYITHLETYYEVQFSSFPLPLYCLLMNQIFIYLSL